MLRLLPSRMDRETKRVIQDAQIFTPRYLFRGWRNGTSPSGGLEGLNTEDAITPRAFSDNGEAATKTIYDLSRAELRAMLRVHLSKWEATPGNAGYRTEFSSWAASLEFAARFTKKDPTAFISVIDTTRLKNSNAIVRVPLLNSILGSDFDKKNHEYIAHGVISGEAHKAVTLQAMLDIQAPIFARRAHIGVLSLISQQEIVNAKSVGRRYGLAFEAAVTLAILCSKQRDHVFWRDGTNGVERVLDASMSDFDIPDTLCTDATIMTDIVYTQGFGEVEQMIRMLRAIVNLRYGRGARRRIIPVV